MREKVDFIQKLKSRLPQIEKESLYRQLLESTQETLLLQEVCQHLEEGILLVDAKGIPVFRNRQAHFFLKGVRSDNKLPIWNQIQEPSLAAYLKENLTSVKSRTVYDLKIFSPRDMRLRVITIPLEQDSKKNFLVVFLDVTHHSEKELETLMLARLESLIRLAGGIAHEIGNPLNAITIHLELLKKSLAGLPEPKRQELENSLSDIQDETKRLDRIIKNFLKATRKPPLRFQMDDLNTIMADALSFLKPQLDEAHIFPKFVRDTDLPMFLMDRERLYYAFMNLIKNAIEAMPKGGTLKATITHQESCAMVTITDTGCGITKENLSKIFDIYYTTKKEGAGLGLMMVYDAIAEHGGKIEVASRPNKGSTFKILLPIREPQRQLPHYKVLKGG